MTPTERLVVSVRGRTVQRMMQTSRPALGDSPPVATTTTTGLVPELDLTSLYFEGDLGELFPKLDPRDRRRFDLGIVLGRAPIAFQGGLLVDDTMDVIGITREANFLPRSSSFRLSILHAWNGVDQGSGRRAGLTGVFAEVDHRQSTIALDLAHVDDAAGPDSLHLGVSSSRRAGRWNLSGRALGSRRLGREGLTRDGDGVLLTGSLSTTPRGTHHLLYANAFTTFGHYRSAARAASCGGALRSLGLAFEGAGLGTVSAAPLDPTADRASGAVFGLQVQQAAGRRQWVFELAGRGSHGGPDRAINAAARFQQALGRRFVVRVDAHAAGVRHDQPDHGARTELLMKF